MKGLKKQLKGAEGPLIPKDILHVYCLLRKLGCDSLYSNSDHVHNQP